MSDLDRIERRLAAVERAVVDGDGTVAELAERSTLVSDVEMLASRLDELEQRIATTEGTVGAMGGFVGRIESVNEAVERQANSALTTVDRLDRRIDTIEDRLDYHGIVSSHREAHDDGSPRDYEESTATTDAVDTRTSVEEREVTDHSQPIRGEIFDRGKCLDDESAPSTRGIQRGDKMSVTTERSAATAMDESAIDTSPERTAATILGDSTVNDDRLAGDGVNESTDESHRTDPAGRGPKPFQSADQYTIDRRYDATDSDGDRSASDETEDTAGGYLAAIRSKFL